jgi:hypothetical protein
MAVIIDQTKETMWKIMLCAFNLHQSADISDEVADEVLGYFRTNGAEVGTLVNISSRSIQTAVRLVVPGAICRRAVSEGNKFVKC